MAAWRRSSARPRRSTRLRTQSAGLEQNAAHVAALRNIAGSDADLAAAEAARKKATSPLYAQAAESAAQVNPSRVAGLIDRIVGANPKREALTGPLGKVRESLYEDFPLQARGQEAWKALDDMLTAGPKLGKGDTAMLGEVRTVMDRVKKGAIDQEAALGQLKGLSGINDVAIGALEDARRYLKMPGAAPLERSAGVDERVEEPRRPDPDQGTERTAGE
jgi:hypothetical protein